MKSLLNRRAFTLIELLIVVAIIAILAAIAVPNFLEAQTRSKISRALADMRTIRTGLESYAVDNNKYPETDQALSGVAAGKRSILRLTTPIAYLTSIPQSPFNEVYGSGGNPFADPKIATELNSYLYVRALPSTGETVSANASYTTAYIQDRRTYLFGSALVGIPQLAKGAWLMKSVGPNNVDDQDTNSTGSVQPAAIYDASNGTISPGEIIIFSDVGGSLK